MLTERGVEWFWGVRHPDTQNYTSPIWAFDIETNGAPVDSPDLRISLLGIADDSGVTVYPEPLVPLALSRMEYALNRGVRLFGHNSIGFDSEAIWTRYKVYFSADDTLLLAHQLDEWVGNATRPGYGTLERLCVDYLGVEPWKQQVTWEWDKMTADDLQKAAHYNAEDSAYTLRLAQTLVDKAKEAGLGKAYALSRAAAVSLTHFVAPQGIAIAMDRLRSLRDELRVTSLDAKMFFEQGLGHPINLHSPKQVGKALFEELNFPVVHSTKTGTPSTDELTLKTLLLENSGLINEPREKLLRALLTERSSTKLIQFLDKYEELQRGGRLYASYSTTSTVTFRTSAKNPNIQQMPHDKRVRGLLTAAPGNVLTEADYSQIELREIAELSGSETLRKIFADDIDPHRFMASKITGKPMDLVTDQERYVAKPVNYGLSYGGDSWTLRKQALLDYGIVLAPEEAQRYHDLFHSTYNLEPWYDNLVAELRSTGMVRNPIGRIRHLPEFKSANPTVRAEAVRQAFNFPIQSFSCDIALLALIEAVNRGLNVVAFVHDAIYVESPEHIAALVGRELREIMTVWVPQYLTQHFGVTLVVPLDVDIKTTHG